MASRSQQSRTNVTRGFSPSSQPNSKPSEHQRWSLSFTDIRPYVPAAVVMVCHVTTTDYFRSLSGKHALHSRTVVLHCRDCRLSIAQTRRYPYAGISPMISRMRDKTSASAASSRLWHRLSGLLSDAFIRNVNCARDTPRTRLTGAIPCPKVTRAHALSIFAIVHTPPLLWGSQLPWFSYPVNAEAD